MIFISYSWSDAPIAHRLHRTLKLSGLDTWIDFERLNLACGLETQLAQAICSAKVILLLDSPAARFSKWIRFELSCAESAGTPVTLYSRHSYEQLVAAHDSFGSFNPE